MEAAAQLRTFPEPLSMTHIPVGATSILSQPLYSMCSLSPSSRCSPPWSCKSNIYDGAHKEYGIKVYSAIEFSSITIGDLADEKSTLANFTIRKLEHCKEARGHSGWEHEFLVAEIHRPDNSAEVAGVLVIDRENRPSTPDIVRVIPMNALCSSTPLPHILSRIGYHPYNLGRSCEFDSPHSVGEIASILAEKSRTGGKYSSHDKNCYWYANEVFNHCSDTYGGRTTNGPYCNDLGHFMGGKPQNAVKEGLVNVVRCGSFVVLGAGIAAASAPLVIGGIVVAGASILASRASVSQAEPLQS